MWVSSSTRKCHIKDETIKKLVICWLNDCWLFWSTAKEYPTPERLGTIFQGNVAPTSP